MPTSPDGLIPAGRSALVGTAIDFEGDAIKFQTIVAPAVYTIVNPVLDRVITVEIDGIFAVTLPGTVDVVSGDYLPNLGKNYLMIHCVDATTPAYVATWSTGI
jgi:hypothetical protein